VLLRRGFELFTGLLPQLKLDSSMAETMSPDSTMSRLLMYLLDNFEAARHFLEIYSMFMVFTPTLS
jgi:hypothetical protein